MIKIRNKNGFTLLEILLGVGLIGLASIAIYDNYNKKRDAANVQRQSLLLEDLKDRAIKAFSAATNPAVMATTENFIAMRSVPADMLDLDNNIITNVFGGNIEISGTAHLSDPNNFENPVPRNENEAGTIIITLNNIPDYACAKLALTEYGDESFAFDVNGIPIKMPGEPPMTEHINMLTNSCVMGNNNSISFTHSLFQPDLLDFRVIGNDSKRAKENSINIAQIGKTSLAPQDCSGGALWMEESSSCMCPATAAWNGVQCVPFNSGIGNCEPGFGWNGTQCVPHLMVGQVGSHVNLKDSDFGMPVGSQVQNSGLVIQNGRRILNIDYPSEIINNVHVDQNDVLNDFTKSQCVPNNENADLSEVGNWNGHSCIYCKNGSIWNSTLLRCETQ